MEEVDEFSDVEEGLMRGRGCIVLLCGMRLTSRGQGGAAVVEGPMSEGVGGGKGREPD